MYRFGIVGGDVRMGYLYESLKKDGFTVCYAGADSMGAILPYCDIMVLPINKFDLLADCKNKTVLGGFTAPFDTPEGATVLNYLTDSVYTVKNALATAEGAVYLAMQNQNTLIQGKNIAICGFGNIGKILCAKLLALGARVTICARDKKQRAEAENMGAEACDFSALALFKPSMIFNTVPATVLTPSVLSAISPETVIIELASKPGGIDKNYADAHGFPVVDGGALPAKYCPKYAGEILKNTVLSMLREV